MEVPDTTRGLVLLGLDEKNAKYAAYALHAVFSYPTSEKWLPELNSTLPIHVANMGKTRWGRNWGSYERIDWVDDVEIDKVRVTFTCTHFVTHVGRGTTRSSFSCRLPPRISKFMFELIA